MAGKPGVEGQPFDITTGLKRFSLGVPNPLHWHMDPRFSHYTIIDDDQSVTGAGDTQKSVKETLASLSTASDMADAIVPFFLDRLEGLLQSPKGSISQENSPVDLGLDSLIAVEIRGWIYKTVAKDVAVLKILGASSIHKCKSVNFYHSGNAVR